MPQKKASFKIALSIVLCLPLTGCLISLGGGEAEKPVVSSLPPPPPCPARKTFPVEKQKALAAEWNALPEDSATGEALTDWERYRRACKQ